MCAHWHQTNIIIKRENEAVRSDTGAQATAALYVLKVRRHKCSRFAGTTPVLQDSPAQVMGTPSQVLQVRRHMCSRFAGTSAEGVLASAPPPRVKRAFSLLTAMRASSLLAFYFSLAGVLAA